MRAVRRNRVMQDVDEQALYIARDNVPAALRFLEAVETAVDRICDLPLAGTVCDLEDDRHTGLRFWPIRSFENHLIFYFVRTDHVEIFRLFPRSARHTKGFRSRVGGHLGVSGGNALARWTLFGGIIA